MTSQQYVVRPVAAADARAFRMLLPEVVARAAGWVAISTKDRRIVGAAALLVAQRGKSPTGPGAALHVIEPCRRQGIGRLLLREILQAAKDQGAEAVFAVRRVDVDSPEAAAWQALGFEPLETVLDHELALADVEARLTPLMEQIREQGWIPDNARIVPLCDADRAAVARLHLDQLGGDQQDLLRRLQGQGVGAYQQIYSRVLIMKQAGRDTTVGCLLAHRQSQKTAVVDANVIDPSVQGGWANIWLKLEATLGARSLGIERFIYRTFDHYAETRAFTEQLGGQVVRTQVLMHRPVK